MKLKTIALDYDGTIADEGRLNPDVRKAIARAREHGILVLIVTGRILGELRAVAGELTFVDAVVAENGAVIAFPASGRSTVLHSPPSRQFLDSLAGRGVPFTTGEVVVEAEAIHAPAVLEVIRQLEQPLSLLFNRSRMMILPQAISKATGCAAALDALRLSAHNVLAIGDAENDYELLRMAEFGVAVQWGSEGLKAVADEVLDGTGPAAVAGYLDAQVTRAAAGRGLRVRRQQRRLVLGTTTDGEDISLEVTGRNVVISGDPRSGKSWVAGLLCEQLILYGYSVFVVDPEGDYSTLEALPRVSVLGGDDPPPKPHDLLRLLRHPDRSIVLDLSRLTHSEKCDYLRETLPQIALIRQRNGLPHRVLVDEAHYFFREGVLAGLFDHDSGGCTATTYQTAHLHPDLLHAADVVLVTRATDPQEIATLAEAVGASAEVEQCSQILADLAVDEVALLPNAAEAHGRIRRIRLVERLTPHVRHRSKYLDVPVADHHAFAFCHNGCASEQVARTLNEFVDIVATAAPQSLAIHLQRGDFSRWIVEVFGDRQLATTIRRLEDNHRLARISDINDAIAVAVRERYELAPREN
jgi:hydroxymethylpyrimidine pyrophosphatase-like HAD family hydrolase